MSDWYDAGPSTYTGAPDECNIHWPTKFDADGNCPECFLPHLPLDMSFRWELSYTPVRVRIRPTFVTDLIMWPIPPCGHRNYCDCDLIRREAEAT